MFWETKLAYIFLQPVFFLFWKWNFLALRIQNFRREFSEFKKIKETALKKFLIFEKMELSSLKLKKNSYISSGKLQSLKNKQKDLLWKNFLYFSKKISPHILGWLLIKQLNKKSPLYSRRTTDFVWWAFWACLKEVITW